MDEPATNATEQDGNAGQLLLIGLCIVGLVVAAFLAPPAASPQTTGPGESADGGPSSQQGGSSDATPTAAGGGESGGSGESAGDGKTGGEGDGDRSDGQREQHRQDDDVDVVGGSEPIPIPGGDAGGDVGGCGVIIDDRPIPGAPLTVTVYQDLRPATNTTVWFNDRFAGRTDTTGSVTARVPYTQNLNVTVEQPGDDPCEFFRYPYESETESSVTALETQPKRSMSKQSALLAGMRPLSEGPSGVPDALSVVPQLSARTQQEPTANATGRYEVTGTVNVTVEGDPYPETRGRLVATIDGVPMRNATVTVDGTPVGTTDAKGTYRFEVPDRDTVVVGVSRGDYAGNASVDVLNLHVRVESADPFPIPWEPAKVNATINDEPVEGATITVGGKQLGTTGPDGTVAAVLPTEPSLTVTAATTRQTATTSFWPVYLPTILVGAFLFFASFLCTFLAGIIYQRYVALQVGTLWAAVDIVYTSYVIWEQEGLMVLIPIVALLYRYRETLLLGSEAAASGVTRLRAWIRRAGLTLVDGIEHVIDGVTALATQLGRWLRSLPLSVRSLAIRCGRWARRLPARISVRLRENVTGPRIGGLLLAAAVIIGASGRWGVTGFVGAATISALSGAIAWLWRRNDGQSTATELSGTARTEPATATGDEGDSAPSIRILWRRFARWVAPGNWRTRTPVEIADSAVEKGLPSGPVSALTSAFRAVEYGGKSETTRRAVAREAFDALWESRQDSEEDG